MYVELLIESLPDADRAQTEQLLRQLGFDPVPMKVGFLLAGEVTALKRLFPTLTGSETNVIATPETLRTYVQSVRLFKPRSLYSP